MYNIYGLYLKKKNIENFNNNKIEGYNGINIIIDTKLSDVTDKNILKTQVIDSLEEAGNNSGKYNIRNEITSLNIYEDTQSVTNTLVWSLPPGVEISEKEICENSGFTYALSEDDGDYKCFKDIDNNEIVEINIQRPMNEQDELYKKLCNDISKFGFNYRDGKCFDPNGDLVDFDNSTPLNLETFKNNIYENNTTVEVSYTQNSDEEIDLQSNLAAAISKSGNIPLDSLSDPVLISAPEPINENIPDPVNNNIPEPVNNDNYFSLNNYDNVDSKIITDVTFYNSKLSQLTEVDISSIISSICKNMNQECEVIFYESFNENVKGQFVIKLKDKNYVKQIKNEISKQFKNIGININSIKVL